MEPAPGAAQQNQSAKNSGHYLFAIVQCILLFGGNIGKHQRLTGQTLKAQV